MSYLFSIASIDVQLGPNGWVTHGRTAAGSISGNPTKIGVVAGPMSADEAPASQPLDFLLRGWQQRVDKKRNLVDDLLPIAGKTPQALRLNLVVATQLVKNKRNPEAKELLEACYEKIQDDPKKRQQSGFIVLISDLARFYRQKEDFARGDELLQEVLIF